MNDSKLEILIDLINYLNGLKKLGFEVFWSFSGHVNQFEYRVYEKTSDVIGGEKIAGEGWYVMDQSDEFGSLGCTEEKLRAKVSLALINLSNLYRRKLCSLQMEEL